MESLLKMSGLLSEEDAGKTDLGTLEKRLAEKASTTGETKRREAMKAALASSTPPVPDSHHNTPQHDTHSSPRNSTTTPTSDADKERNEEVENLSDMMCSLVTNNCGETKYIGEQNSSSSADTRTDMVSRLVVGVLDIFAQGYTMG